MASAPTTQLDAINSILSAVGEAPITSTEFISNSVSATIANNILNEVDRGFQSKGWSFNTEYGGTLTRNTSNFIYIPSNTIRITFNPTSNVGLKPIQRGTRIYDAENNTYVFSQNIIWNEKVTLLDFSELPESARNYIIVKASRLFLLRTRPEETQLKVSEIDEQYAFSVFLDYEVRVSDNANWSKYSSELSSLGINQSVFLSASTDEKVKLLQTASANLQERQTRLYYQNRVENKTTTSSDTYDTYRTQFNRLGLSEKEFLALEPIQKEEALVIAKGTTTSTDTRASSFNTTNIQTNLRKLGISFKDFLAIPREQQQLLLDGASGLDNIIGATATAVASFENNSQYNKALNNVLRYLNIPPVSSVTASDTAYNANKLLSEISKLVQSEGWYYNTEKSYTLIPDSSGLIFLSQIAYPVLKVDGDKYNDYQYDLVIRDEGSGKMLWDLNTSSGVFSVTTKVNADIVLELPFESMPESIKRYIIIRTAKELSAIMNMPEAVKVLAMEEQRARLEAIKDDSEQSDSSMFDNYDVARILDRGSSISNLT
ncbi:MAG: hypothetical protein EBU90_06845 [Proteobacteria bacterium]|nr:hypothetical protein [Pseudomonadota bacterium]NBP14035.1 hypothetical protein [bacterium]